MLDEAALTAMLEELRGVGSDTQLVEAKRARTALPQTTWETLSAFANGVGGTLLLGVDEGDGQFTVTGVDDPGRTTSNLQSECAELEPPLRPVIATIQLPEGAVVVAEIESLPRTQRPCHRRLSGPHASSFIRVGDSDQRLRSSEVDAMLAVRSGHDHSAKPAPDGAVLDAAAAAEFCAQQRTRSERSAGLADAQILEASGVTDNRSLTLAGLLALGRLPQRYSPSARMTVRRHPTPADPPGTRHSGEHLEGTIGELLDDALSWLRQQMGTVQVFRHGGLFDDTDVPLEALREIISNALVHRSFAADDTAGLIELSHDAVVVTSPGGIHVSNDPALLGLGARNGLRNLTLVRICEQLRTPAGARIVEGQNVGIALADRACRAAGTLPAMFADLPTSFQVTMARRSIDPAPAKALADAANVTLSADQHRALSVIHRVAGLGDETVLNPWADVPVDARFIARALAGASVEDAAVVLHDLETAGLLTRSRSRMAPAWFLATRPEAAGADSTQRGRRGTDRVPELLAAIAASPTTELRATEIGKALGLKSPTSRKRWIDAALDQQLIEPTRSNPFDPAMAYRLTAKGTRQVGALAAGMG